MSYDYVSKVDSTLASQLHLRLIKSDESYVVIGENDDARKYKEEINVRN